MKIILRLGVIIFCIIALVYFGQAQKAKRIKEIRIKASYEKGEISQEDYQGLIKKNTLSKILLNPKDVMGAD